MYFRFDPDEWRPAQGRGAYSRTTAGRLEPDSIVVWDRQPYRVIEVRERDQADWPQDTGTPGSSTACRTRPPGTTGPA